MIPRPSDSDQTLLFGTRGSALALMQTELAKARFRAMFSDWDVTLAIISTEGDRDKQSPLAEIGGRGVFTTALEAAVLAERVDAAVHSAKDLPTALHPEAPIVAFPERADPGDVLVSRHGVALDRLPPNPHIGTSSRRRAVQIKRLRPDARIIDLRGNLDTRLRKAAGCELDGIVVAAAGLERMGWGDRIVQRFSVDEVTPSPAQGALAIQARRDSLASSMLARIDDPLVSAPVAIERAFLAAIGAGCTWPVGAYVSTNPEGMHLTAMLADVTGERVVHVAEHLATGREAAHAAEIASRMWAEASAAPVGSSRSWSPRAGDALAGARVVVTRPRLQAGSLVAAFRAQGAIPIELPTISIEPIADTSALDRALCDVWRGAFDWLIFTSVNAVAVCLERIGALGLRHDQIPDINVAAVGLETAAMIQVARFPAPLVPEVQTAEALAAALIRAARRGARMLYPRSAIGRESLPIALREAGMEVVSVNAYETRRETKLDPDVVECVQRGEIDLISFSSPSSVHGFMGLMGAHASGVLDVPCICAGPVSAGAAAAAGFAAVSTAREPGAEAMAAAAARMWRRRCANDEASNDVRGAMAASGTRAIGRSGD